VLAFGFGLVVFKYSRLVFLLVFFESSLGFLYVDVIDQVEGEVFDFLQIVVVVAQALEFVLATVESISY
jgi:uncharacterized membrane protein required for colicin V production